jgi:uncharacterized membrane protein YcaP (DUF421 family)
MNEITEEDQRVELDWIWHSILIFFIGKLILRLGGRKSISQMTITQTIVMIGIGSLLIKPVSGKGLVVTFGAAFVITLLMIATEYLEVKIDLWETIFTGKAVNVIENGKPNIRNLSKLRMSIDRLETRLRQDGISSIADVQHGTIEVSGQLGYELVESKKPLTKEDLAVLMNEISHIKQALGVNTQFQASQNRQKNIFTEINTKKYEGNKNEP